MINIKTIGIAMFISFAIAALTYGGASNWNELPVVSTVFISITGLCFLAILFLVLRPKRK